jgi:CheY-like chemotaxis protein
MPRVLVADDDPMMRDMIAMTLTRSGHVFKTAESGNQALSMIEADEFDVVVADIFMPEGTGIELLISLRAKNIEVPFICISGGDGELFRPYAATMISLGATTVLKKPFTPEQLMTAISRSELGGAN